jgi:hypothetical protein
LVSVVEVGPLNEGLPNGRAGLLGTRPRQPGIYSGEPTMAYTRLRTNVEQARHLNHRSCLVLDPSRRKFDPRHFCVRESRIVRQVSLSNGAFGVEELDTLVEGARAR